MVCRGLRSALVLTLMAVALFALVALLERVTCPWNRRKTLV